MPGAVFFCWPLFEAQADFRLTKAGNAATLPATRPWLLTSLLVIFKSTFRRSAVSSVLITGTSKGIGYDTALMFARAGHKVFATMRNPAQSDLGEVAAREKLSIAISVMDVDLDESVRDGISKIVAEHGPVDVLVNNAGIEAVGAVEELALAVFRSTMETNYFGCIRTIQSVVGPMRERRSGCIVNISSVAGRIASPPLTPYMASKWALEALSEGLAGELKNFNVRVAIVEPGIIDTSMARRIGEPQAGSPYPQTERFANLFAASVQQNPVPATVVAQKVLEIVESGTWQLRHPIGPDAAPFIAWRQSLTDEQWTDLYSSDDDTWYEHILRDFGLDTRPKTAAAD
jgi:NAD(P)-dependent dehydrogenase (short-subunit alcohol dehydrogenase family)